MRYGVRGTRYICLVFWIKCETKGVAMWHRILSTRLKVQRETNEVRRAQLKTVSPKGVIE